MTTSSTSVQIDPSVFKSAMRAQWDAAAQGWNAHAAQIGDWLRPATRVMLEMAEVGSGARVLDIAAGSGDQTLDIARRVGAKGYVLATDLSAAILALAQENAQRAALSQVHTQVADGENLQVPHATFDAAVCRLGLMLFPDPLRGLREMHRALKPGGKACVLVFAQPAHNPCITILMSTALQHAGMAARDPFQPGGLLSLGRPGHLETLFKEAGFSEISTTTLDAPFAMPSASAYLDFIRSSASPIRSILSRLDDDAAGAAWRQMEERLSVFNTSTGWEGPNELLLVVGRR